MLCVMITMGCLSQQEENNPAPAWRHPKFKPYFMASDPEYWNTNLGKSVSVRGVAVQGKMGARLNSERGALLIDGLSLWPRDVVWQIVSVTGTVIKRHDGPQLSKEQLELPPGQQVQGTRPTGEADPEGSKELHQARRRYLLKDVKYTVVKEEPGVPNKPDAGDGK